VTKNANWKSELEKIAGRLQLSTVDVDGVAEGLEGIEGDADRQEHVEEGRVRDLDAEEEPKDVGGRLRGEVEVLEQTKQPHVRDEADN